MKTSEFIRLAKSHLWDGQGKAPGWEHAKKRYICGCLEIQSQPSSTTDPCPLDKAVDHVMHLLGGCVYLESWLTRIAKVPRHEIDANLPRLQATRLAWMEDMAKWFEAQGD